MTRNRVLAMLVIAALLLLGSLGYQNHVASQTKPAAEKDTLVEQVKELKKQVNDLQARSQVVAAGTTISKIILLTGSSSRNEEQAVRNVERAPLPAPFFRSNNEQQSADEAISRDASVLVLPRDDCRQCDIRKLKTGQYRLYSRKVDPKTGKRRSLGTFHTRAEAVQHERDVQFLKRG